MNCLAYPLNQSWILGACSYVIFGLMAVHPFIDFHSSLTNMEAQDITNWLTAGLAVATVWLGAETRKMAVAAKASIELESRPYLAFRGLYVNIGTLQDVSTQKAGAFRIGLRLANPGKVLITYKVDSMLVSLAGNPAANPHFDTTSGVIHPADETTFFYPVIATTTSITAPSEAVVEYAVSYWAIETERKSMRAKVRLLITSATTHEWIYLDGPHYA